MTHTDLSLDSTLIDKLRTDLQNADWTVEAVEASMSPMAQAALERDQLTPASVELADLTSSSSILTRLFILAEQVPRAQATQAFQALDVGGAVRLGVLAELGEGDRAAVKATVDLRPHAADLPSYEEDAPLATTSHHWWVASDLGQAQTGAPPKDDHVLGIASASTNLLRVTMREPISRALDLGCGCGILALYLKTHADHVVATDISERACVFTRFNAALNRVDIDVREGSLFEPVRGETFDLITSNPPFVITPASVRGRVKLDYRDGGMARDNLVRNVIEDSVHYLSPGGTLQMLANWEVGSVADEWMTRPTQWVEDASKTVLESAGSVDAWVVQRDLVDVSQYAEWWMRDAHGDQHERGAWDREYRQWLEDFDAAGTRYVGLGSIALRVGDGSPGELRLACEYLPDVLPVDAGAVATALANLSLPSDWVHRSLIRGEDVREIRYFVPGAADPELVRLSQGRPGGRERTVSSSVAALVGVSDGELTPSQVIPAIAMLLEKDEEEVIAELEAALPELLRSGTVRFLTA